MNEFIKSNISTTNKNNHIFIGFGKEVINSIFNTKLSKNTVESFLQNLKSNENIYFKTFIQKIYKNKNFTLILDKKKKVSYTSEIKNYCVCNSNIDMLMINRELKDFQDEAISTYNYENVQSRQQLSAEISNMFTLQIDNYIEDEEEYYNISIVIKKPNDVDKLISRIKEITSYF